MPSNPTITITLEGDHPHLAELLAAISSITSRPATVEPAPAPVPAVITEPTLELFDDLDGAARRAFRGREHGQYPRPYTPKDLRVTGWAMMRDAELEALCREKRTTADLVLFVLDSIARLTGTSGRFSWSNAQLSEVLGIKVGNVTSATSVLFTLGALERKTGTPGGRIILEVPK